MPTLVRHALLIVVLTVFIGLFPISLRTPNHLFNALVDLFFGHKNNHLAQFDTPGSGRNEALPPQVVAMLNLLEMRGADNFRLSPGIVANKKYYERVIEGAYPRLMSNSSSIYVQLEPEQLPPGCQNLVSQQGVTLAQCN